jgi:hypothetical protein
MSAHQLHRTLGDTYKTAWFMAHRTLGHGTERKHRGSAGYGHKRAILALVEHGGAVRSVAIDSPTRSEIQPAEGKRLTTD